MILFKNGWKPVLVNQNCTSFAKAYELNEALESIDSQPSFLVDDHEAVFTGIVRHLGGMDDPDAPDSGWKMMEMTSPSGWGSVIIHYAGN